MYNSIGRCMQLLKWFAGFLTLVVVFTSCEKSSSIGVGEDETLFANITDTVTINTSTMLLDSLPSAGKGVLLVGRINDPELGIISSSSYFQISPSGLNGSSLPTDAVCDSVRLRLNYSGYYYGDTLQKQDISVYQLSERLVLPKVSDYLSSDAQNVFSSSATFYNRSKFRHDPAPLTTHSYYPKPGSDSLMLRLPDNIGKSFFNLVKEESALISNTDLFLDYFKGIVLKPGVSAGNAIVGFRDSVGVKIYYSYVDGEGNKKKQEMVFSLYDNSYQFNHFDADRSNTKLNDIGLSNPIVSSDLTSDKTYIQAMTGLVTRISIPYIRFLNSGGDVVINKAELLVETPGAPYYLPFERPAQLVLLVADKNNRPTQILSDPQTSQSALYLSYGDYVEGKASYSFPLTEYISSYYSKYNNTSLLLTVPVADLQNTFNRLIVGSQANAEVRIKLRVTYTKLKL